MNSLFRPTASKRVVFFLFFDAIISLISLYIAYLLRFNFDIPNQFFQTFWITYITITTLKLGSLLSLKNYFIVWRFFSFGDAAKIFYAHIIGYGLFWILYAIMPIYFAPFPRSVIIIDFLLSLILIGSLRASKRFFTDKVAVSSTPVILIGVNSQTATMIQSAMRGDIDYYPVAIIQTRDNESSNNAYINNVKIYHISKLEELLSHRDISTAIITRHFMPTELKEIITTLNNHGIDNIKKVKLIGDNSDRLEDISIEDLLARTQRI